MPLPPDVNQERRSVYGHPYDEFSRTVQMLNALGFCRRLPGSEETRDLVPEDWPVAQICQKLSREANSHHLDNLVDIRGYVNTWADVLDRIEESKTT